MPSGLCAWVAPPSTGARSPRSVRAMPLETSKKPLTAIGLYDFVEQVAEGGMGTVYRARHRETGDMVAVKVMTTNMTGNPVLLKRFEQEFHAARRLDHPNIVRALDFG